MTSSGHRMTWYGPSKAFIERWKNSSSHVFFDFEGNIFYLATMAACAGLVARLGKGQFALSMLKAADLVKAVMHPKTKTPSLFEKL